ncbi:MAG: aminopeptidase P family protein [Gammaproteobacteria bacterium]|nr:aminopeptidase P family protein [Gammaproteobacteria bacterium]
MFSKLIAGCMILALAASGKAGEAEDPVMPDVLDLREQGRVRDAWLAKRLDTVVPKLMQREGIDLWLLVAREYNEDPVVETMLPATWLAARRRTVLVFHDPGGGAAIDKLSVSRYSPGPWFDAAWNPEEQDDQWRRVAEIIAERDPERIAINRSDRFPLADGLTASEEDALVATIGEKYAARLVSGENLSLGWLETRIPEEMAVYPIIVRMAHAIIAQGFSERVITPGITTTGDVEWWYRERIRVAGLETWFHPSVSVERAGESEQSMVTQFAGESPSPVIEPGDLLHVDFGITYLGLNTDTQHHAYVLKPGETDAPAGLKAGISAGNHLQEILMSNFRVGITGNELLAESRDEAIAAGLEPTIYSHAIGFHGHGAGPWIGMWDDQYADPPMGDYPIHPNTAWSIELNVRVAVAEWGGKVVRFKSEEDAYFDGTTIRFLDGRQERLHLIPRQ